MEETTAATVPTQAERLTKIGWVLARVSLLTPVAAVLVDIPLASILTPRGSFDPDTLSLLLGCVFLALVASFLCGIASLVLFVAGGPKWSSIGAALGGILLSGGTGFAAFFVYLASGMGHNC